MTFFGGVWVFHCDFFFVRYFAWCCSRFRVNWLFDSAILRAVLTKLIVWIPGSIPSLAAGLTFGGISAAAAHQTSAHPRNLWVMLGRSLWLLQINEKIGRKMHKFLWFIFECVALADYVHCLNKVVTMLPFFKYWYWRIKGTSTGEAQLYTCQLF